MGMTAVMAIGLTLFAIQTKWDFTRIDGTLFVALIVFICAIIIGWFLRSHIFGGVTFFSVYLIRKY